MEQERNGNKRKYTERNVLTNIPHGPKAERKKRLRERERERKKEGERTEKHIQIDT